MMLRYYNLCSLDPNLWTPPHFFSGSTPDGLDAW